MTPAEAIRPACGFEKTAARIRASAAPLRALGVSAVTVFGSRASGAAHPASDADLVIETAGPRLRYGDFLKIADLLEDALLTEVDVLDAAGRGPELAQEAARTGRRIAL
jgi:uncharacterized protein